MSNPFDWDSLRVQIDYLKVRGFDEITIRRLQDRGLYFASQHELRQLGIEHTHLDKGIVWVLKDIAGRPTGKYGARVWYNNLGFVPDDDKPKFLPPKGQVPGVYFTPLVNWGKLKYGQRVYLCESYLKADILGMLGFYALGVSGCWGWSYQEQLNWDFGQLPWKEMRLNPVVFMDSNVRPDNGLYQAASKFRAQFDVKYHIDARIIVLPGPGGDQSWGCDDFYVKEGKDKLVGLLEGDANLLPNEIREHLKILNMEVCLITEITRFVTIATGQLMKKGEFEDVHYADRMADDNEGKKAPVAKIWNRWDGRNVVEKIVYRPGITEKIIEDGTHRYYNSWKGMGCEPLAGDVTLFTSWVNDVFHTDVEREFFLNWWAWQLQNPGKKLTTCLVVIGSPGIGKGWMTRIAELIWGRTNVAKAPLGVLKNNFNAELAHKQLFIVEETDEYSVKEGGNQIYNKLKEMITSTTLRIEPKGVDAYDLENTVNIFLTGNQLGVLRPDNGDRRFMVCEVSGDKSICNAPLYWDDRWSWVETRDGAQSIMGFLLRKDLTGFNPYGEAPITLAKRDMIDITHHPIEKWIQELKEDYKSTLVVAGVQIDGRLITAKEAYWVYQQGLIPMSEITKKDAEYMNRALKNARIPVASGGGKIKVKGVPNRYFLLEGEDRSDNWAKEVQDRQYWARLVASARGQVASGVEGGYPETKF